MTYKFGTNFGRIGTARSANLQAYYKFDGDLTDSSGNGLTLGTDAGTVRYGRIGNLQTIMFKGGLRLSLSIANSATLQQTGARSVHCFVCPEVVTNSATADLFYLVGNDGADSEARNNTAHLVIQQYQLQWLTESGSGDNNAANLDGYSLAENVPLLITVTRDASGNVQFYLNGAAAGSAVSIPSPTGGGEGRLGVGGFFNSTYDYTGAMAELQFLNIELTAAQVLEDARKVMPWL